MKVLMWLVPSLVLGGAADDLMTARIGAVQLKVPAAWKRSVDQGTTRFDAPSEDASFSLDVIPLDSPLAPALCRDKLVKALGGEGWENLSVGAAPAARKSYVDVEGGSPGGGKPGEEKSKRVEVRTYSYVGCNGKTKWALTF